MSMNNNVHTYEEPLNEFDNERDRTPSYIEQRNVLSKMSIACIVRACEYFNKLVEFVPQDNEMLEDFAEVIAPLEDVCALLATDEKCPGCGGVLYKSDLPQYDFVCPECDENY